MTNPSRAYIVFAAGFTRRSSPPAAAAAQTVLARLHSEKQEHSALYEDEHGEPTADSIAQNTETINYEVVCLVGKRVPRIYYQNGVMTDVMYKL